MKQYTYETLNKFLENIWPSTEILESEQANEWFEKHHVKITLGEHTFCCDFDATLVDELGRLLLNMKNLNT